MEDLLPWYIFFMVVTVILSIIILFKYGLQDSIVLISLSWIFIIMFTTLDIGEESYYEGYGYYGEVQEANLKEYYQNHQVNGVYLEDVIWYSQKQTVYVFFKEGNITNQDIDDIVKPLKPLDNLDITVLLINPVQKVQLIKRFTNNKKFIGIPKDEYLINSGEEYYFDDGPEVPPDPDISRYPISRKGLVQVIE